jgi:hypothetical protein
MRWLRKIHHLALCVDFLMTLGFVPLRERSSLALMFHNLSPTAAVIGTAQLMSSGF